MTSPHHYGKSQAYYARAQQLIPGGFHRSGRPLISELESPLYFNRGTGGYIWDVDGHRYVDLLMAYGPFLLGYADTEVDQAGLSQMRDGSLLSLNHPIHITFIDALLQRFTGADMGIFFKTGSEATTGATRIARRATGRRLIARCGYHGWHDWCLPEEDFVPAGLDAQVLTYEAHKPETLVALLKSRPNAFAAVILSPEMIYPPQRNHVTALQEAAHAHGALFIMDEIKTGFRAPGGSMQALLGITPDMATVSKALGNGWPVAAILGRRDVMSSAAGMHLSATYHGDVGAMAAALKTLEILDRDNVADRVNDLGQILIDGLNAAAERQRFPAEAYGEPIPAMPFMRITTRDPEDQVAIKTQLYAHILENGILLHPRHMWFLCAAHTLADVHRAIAVVEEGMHATMAQR